MVGMATLLALRVQPVLVSVLEAHPRVLGFLHWCLICGWLLGSCEPKLGLTYVATSMPSLSQNLPQRTCPRPWLV